MNHKQTATQEVEGQYLWSPKTSRGGTRNEFYNNMRRASPGDLVISYSDQHVRQIGRVTEFAVTAPKPREFGSIGENWSQDGWYLPVYWTPLLPAVRPRDLIDVLRPLLPTVYSPIRPATGLGNQGAYLAEISEGVFDTVVAGASLDRQALARGGANSLTYQSVVEGLDDAVEDRIRQDSGLDETIRQSVVQARRGQGRFRANVEALEPFCRVTGITNPSLLIASHIKPWRVCESAHERLDGFNGFLLTPDVDLLFDRGFISFEDDGATRVSKRVDEWDLQRLGLDQFIGRERGLAEAAAAWQMTSMASARRSYLAYHRKEVFIE
ncbi:MAG: HNH endonuclease signature motif containing protein [Tistlia sp.]|uniref:HNH endonuclease n=1 Tax=Tistlia sp. TaxID=3057121 RepID=UPI0034A5B19B